MLFFRRFTVSNPFIEDENQRDIKVRIAGRTIDWGLLYQTNVSQLGALLSFDDALRNR